MLTLANPFYLSLKAGLAVALALFGVQAFGVKDLISAPFVAMVCVSPTIATGLKRGWDQVMASLLGGAITVVLMTILPKGPVVLGLAMALTLLAAFKVGIWRAYVVAGFTVIYTVIIPAATPGVALGNRIASLVIGVVSATLVNIAVSATAYRSIFRRRVELVRLALVDACVAMRDAVADPARRASAHRIPGPVFPLISSIEAELADVRSEGRVRRSVVPVLDEVARVTDRFGRTAHYLAELGFHVEALGDRASEVLPALTAIEQALRGEPVAFPESGEAFWVRDARTAFEAARESSTAPAAPV